MVGFSEAVIISILLPHDFNFYGILLDLSVSECKKVSEKPIYNLVFDLDRAASIGNFRSIIRRDYSLRRSRPGLRFLLRSHPFTFQFRGGFDDSYLVGDRKNGCDPLGLSRKLFRLCFQLRIGLLVRQRSREKDNAIQNLFSLGRPYGKLGSLGSSSIFSAFYR